MPTFMLTHWRRDRSRGPKLSLEYLVKKQSGDTAKLYGLADRGRIKVGLRADINVIDHGRLSLAMPRVVHDLPAGGARLHQGSTGYLATLVKGVTTRRHDADTGARPGGLIRGGAAWA